MTSLLPTAAWPCTPVPCRPAIRTTWELTGLRQLVDVRRHVRRVLTGSCAAGSEEAVERAVLVADELASNSLRHACGPAGLEVSDQGRAWLVVAWDAVPGRLPTPAGQRPAGQGGYGLHVVTDLAIERGVAVGSTGKKVWALLPKS
jgi:two-component sensor histidine kinase